MSELACRCGAFRLEVRGDAVVSAACYCDACREAATRLKALPDAPAILTDHGATRLILYRKDRVDFLAGKHLLAAFRLSPDATTQRVVATCCNTPIFLQMKGAHWLSLYGGLWPEGTLPPLDIRTMTRDLPEGASLPGDVPAAKTQTIGFFAKLFAAWVGMGFRNPMVDVDGKVHA